MALANLSAHRNPLFPDQKSFDIAVRHLTENYKSPLKEGVSIVKSILASAIEESAKEFLDTYPRYLSLQLSKDMHCNFLTIQISLP